MNIFNRSKGVLLALVASLFALTLAGPAAAQVALPEAAVLADIATVAAFVTAIGAAVLGMIFVVKAFKWARRAG